MESVILKFPTSIEISPCNVGFVAKLDKCATYYADLEVLAKVVNPQIRQELIPLEAFAGSC